jgi:drug/metabolite transporter (DMT)-like permease
MHKLIAILNVIAWSGFWAFGYLALTSEPTDTRSVTFAALLAALGAGVGLFAWFWLVRYTEATGYAPPSPQVPREHRREAQPHDGGGQG